MHRLSPVSVTMQIAVLGIGTDNKVEYTTHTLNICVDTTTPLPVVLCLYMTILLSNSRMCNVLVLVGTEMQVPVLYSSCEKVPSVQYLLFIIIVLLMSFIKDPLENEILSCSLLY